MPNRVTSHNDRTLFKAVRALSSDGSMTFDQAMEAVDRMLDAGLLICEPAEREEPKKTTRETDDKSAS